MINIEASGNTYAIRRVLKELKFRWNSVSKTWWKIVPEASLNATLNQLRSQFSYSDIPNPNVIIHLSQVSVRGIPLNDKVMGIKLRPEGARAETDFLSLFNTGELSKGHIVTSNNQSAPPDSAKSIELERKQKSMEGFY